MRARGVGARTVDEHAAECVLRLLVLVVRHRFRIRLEVLKLCRALRMQLHQELSRFRESGGPDVSIVHRWNLETALGVRNLTRGARTRLGLLSGRHARSAARGGPRDDARRRTRRQTSEEKRKAAFAWLQQAVLGSVHAHPESSIGSRILYTIVQGKARQRQRNARQGKALRSGSRPARQRGTAFHRIDRPIGLAHVVRAQQSLGVLLAAVLAPASADGSSSGQCDEHRERTLDGAARSLLSTVHSLSLGVIQ